MREMAYKDNYTNKETLIGYSSCEIRWLNNKYFRGPSVAGEYLVRFNDGTCTVLTGCGGYNTGLDLVIEHIKSGCIITHDDNTEFTPEEILELGSRYFIWFEKYYGEYELEEIRVYDKNPPEYFMIPAFTEESFSKTFNDVNGKDFYDFKKNYNCRTENFGYEKVEEV